MLLNHQIYSIFDVFSRLSDKNNLNSFESCQASLRTGLKFRVHVIVCKNFKILMFGHILFSSLGYLGLLVFTGLRLYLSMLTKQTGAMRMVMVWLTQFISMVGGLT